MNFKWRKCKVSVRHKDIENLESVNTQINQQIHHLSFDEQPFQKAADTVRDGLDLFTCALWDYIVH